jgi:hypothetical protein
MNFAISPADHFAKRFIEMEKIPADTPSQIADANLAMRELCRPLYENLLPSELRSELMRTGDKIKNIWIRGDGDHVPWELILLPAAEGHAEEFLARRYEVTRWIDGYKPPARIAFDQLKLVVPKYPIGRELRCAAGESAFINSLSVVATTPVPAKLKNVVDTLATGGFNVFHFLGHGEQSGQRSGLELEPAEEPQAVSGGERRPYKPAYLRPDSCCGRKGQWRRWRPLIFFNACQSAREDAGLLQPGGWARATLFAQAGAFVGTLWSVRDETAFKFAKAFYTALLDDKMTFGESALAARRTFSDADDPSWLAYVVYAHPNTTVTRRQ